MSEPARDPLDQAIDRIAARLVSVERLDEAMVERIVTRLPERNGWSDWFRVLAPQAALAAVLIVAGFVWTMGDRGEVGRAPVPAPIVADATATARVVPAVAGPGAPVGPTRVAARLATPPSALPADHERSLAAVEAPAALEVVSLASPSLPEEAFVVLAPIVLTELPLSGESISPR